METLRWGRERSDWIRRWRDRGSWKSGADQELAAVDSELDLALQRHTVACLRAEAGHVLPCNEAWLNSPPGNSSQPRRGIRRAPTTRFLPRLGASARRMALHHREAAQAGWRRRGRVPAGSNAAACTGRESPVPLGGPAIHRGQIEASRNRSAAPRRGPPDRSSSAARTRRARSLELLYSHGVGW